MQNFNIAGLIFADGTTYNSGSQVAFYISPNEGQLRQNIFTNYNTQGTGVGFTFNNPAGASDILLRLKYNGSNSWSGYVSPDGISWALISTFSRTLTPTAVGFFVTTWGGAAPYVWSLRYFRKHT